MKKSITLFFGICLISVSLAAQTAKRNIGENVISRYPDNRTEAEKKLGDEKRSAKQGIVIDQPFSRLRNSALKSVLVQQPLNSLLFEEYDKIASQWMHYKKIEYTYDVNGKLTQDKEFEWGDGLWTELLKSEYGYDTTRNLTQRSDYMAFSGNWIKRWKYEYTYDTSGYLTQKILYDIFPLTSEPVYNTKYEYTYDTSGFLTQEIQKYWNSNDSEWINSGKFEYNYNDKGDLVLEFRPWWNWQTSQWDDSWKTDYTYDTNGHLTDRSDQLWTWNGVNIDWEVEEKHSYTYNANNDLMLDTGNYWDLGSHRWNADMSEYLYDTTFAFTDLILPLPSTTNYEEIGFNVRFNERYFNHLLTSQVFYAWDWNSNQFIPNNKIVLNYSVENGIAGYEDLTISVYPNPASDFVVFDIENGLKPALVELYDMQGNKVVSQQLSGNKQISVSQLNSGMYLYNVFLNGKKQSGKIIIK